MSKPNTPNIRRRQSQRSSGIFKIFPQSPSIHYPIDGDNLPLESASNIENFEELSDKMEELEINMSNLSEIHDSITNGFNESFSSFLYGILMTMYCMDFGNSLELEQFDDTNKTDEIDERLDNLQTEIDNLKQKNETLKIKLENKNKIKANVLKTSKNPNISDDSFTSKIPKFQKSSMNNRTIAPKSNRFHTKSSQARLAATQAKLAAMKNARTPDLNQRPRYMDGLFDKSGATRTSTIPYSTSKYR
ncbi:DASH complex subunit Dam1p [[Candida] jaroonii]|uniref:DASH complex subunit Dam1p n=1 Tax=[Candida] jaroonii TaxID=467808 RepID=A0ACA9YC87_9ASCO|nr:DASH complex subunit Dam1p [[Candida] jaroonii]